MQLWPPVEVILILVAVTAPVVLDGPVAVTQSPTARLAEVVDCVSMTVVVEDTAMVVSEGAAVVGGVEVEVVGLKLAPANLTPSTTIEVDPTETSFPLMIAALASPLPSKPAPVPLGKLRGGLLPDVEPPARPPRGPPAPRPKPALQVPDAEG